MSDTILTHDAAVSAFDDAGGVVSSNDDGVTFTWDEDHVVRVNAPSDLTGAFDTDEFFKIEGATIARPIKQPYMVGDSINWYKKPADELRKAAWSFDNAPFTLSHPDTGMVKDVNDVHGFWRNATYDDAEDRLRADLYVPTNDDDALAFIEEHTDVSPGFYNRVADDYDGDTGDLTDDDVDGFQVDMYGNHIAGVERGRCSSEHGCGLDSQDHGFVMDSDVDPETLEHSVENQTDEIEGTEESDISETADCNCAPNNTSDMSDTDTDDDSPFDVPDLSVDALAEKNDAVESVVSERDSLRDEVDEMRTEVEEALDSAEHFSVTLDDDECPCEAVEDLVSELDAKAEKAEKVDDLRDELDEYRAEKIDERLDRLETLGADRDEWEETADDADDPLDTLDDEIERREEVLDAAPETSVKDIQESTDEDTTGGNDQDRSLDGRREFDRGYGA